jgi:hypothetical protein
LYSFKTPDTKLRPNHISATFDQHTKSQHKVLGRTPPPGRRVRK